jgi:hypothetical protein
LPRSWIFSKVMVLKDLNFVDILKEFFSDSGSFRVIR